MNRLWTLELPCLDLLQSPLQSSYSCDEIIDADLTIRICVDHKRLSFLAKARGMQS
jgi:hypothetical protein